MDFFSETFPQTRVHITLYQIQSQTTTGSNNIVEFPDKLGERKKSLSEIAKTHQSNFAVVNASNVISLMHLNLAIAKALIGKRDNQFKTNCLGNEIVYFCSPNHSINSTMEKFGIKNCTTGVFAIFIDLRDQEIAEIKQKLKACTVLECTDLNQHIEWQNFETILEIFDLKEQEKELLNVPNGSLTSMYNKLALKNL